MLCCHATDLPAVLPRLPRRRRRPVYRLRWTPLSRLLGLPQAMLVILEEKTDWGGPRACLRSRPHALRKLSRSGKPASAVGGDEGNFLPGPPGPPGGAIRRGSSCARQESRSSGRVDGGGRAGRIRGGREAAEVE